MSKFFNKVKAFFKKAPKGLLYTFAAIGLVFSIMFVGSFIQKNEEQTKVFVVDELKAISKLTTVEQTFAEDRSFNLPRELFGLDIPFTKKSFVVKYVGKTVVSYDVSELRPNILGKMISISIPAPVVESYITDETIVDEDNNILHPITGEDYNNLRAEFLKELPDLVSRQDLIEAGEKQFKELITNHFEQFGYTVIFS